MLDSLSRLRERAGVMGLALLPPLGEGWDGGLSLLPLWGEVGRGAFSAFCLSCLLVLRGGVGSRPDSRVPFCARPGGEPQKGSFTLAWGGTHIAKQCEWRPKNASAEGCPAELPSLLRRSGQTGSRKSDFLCPSTPVFQLACGVALAPGLEEARACHQLSHMAIAARWMPPKNASAVLS